MRKRVLILLLIVAMLTMVFALASCANGGRCGDGHTWINVEKYSDPTCTESGQVYDRCAVCGIRRKPVTPALGHDYVLVDGTSIAPNCTEPGYEGDFICTRGDCDYIKQGAIVPAKGHKDEDEDHVCDICGNDPCNHIWGDWTDNGDGTHTRVCSLNDSHTETADHMLNDGEVTKPSSCTKDGEIVFTCLDCGCEIFDIIPATEHAYPENWTDNGDNHIKVCGNGCGIDLTADHNHVETNRVEADCENDGTITYICDDCGNEKTETITATGHTYGEWIDEISATCESEGTLGHYNCSVCYKNFDADKNVLESLVIEALGHNYGEWIGEIPASCEGEGTLGHYNCSVCDKDFDADKNVLESLVISATGHTENEAVKENAVEATCTEAGSYDSVVYCSVCREEISRDTIHVDALRHTTGEIVVENEVEATCTEAGSYDNVIYCSTCNTELSRETITIDAKGHVDSDNWIDNYNTGTCSNICDVCDKYTFETREHTIGAEGCTRCGFCAVKLTLMTDSEGKDYYAISGRGDEFYLILSKDGNVDLSSKYVPTEIDGIPVTTIGASVEVDSEQKRISPFRGVDDTKTVTIPSNITTLYDGAFFSSHGLTSINIPASVTYIGDQAFSNCALLTKISFSSNGNLNTIGEYAFSQSGLTEICIPNTVTSIGLAAFIACTKLYKVTFEENTSLTMISQDMLDGCNSLESISIPEGITKINISAFINCSNLNTIDIPESMTRIEQNAFHGCSALAVVNYNSCEHNWNKIKIVINDDNNGNENLVKAEIRCIVDYEYTYDTVNHTAECLVCGHTVGPDAHIFNDDGSCEVCGYQPFVFEVNDDGTLTLVSVGKDYRGYLNDYAFNVIIPGSVNGKEVTIIGANAFSSSEASGTKSIVIPASVTTIEQGAFTGRGSLQSVTFEEGSELTTIEASAFLGCQALSNVELPEGLVTIGDAAFSGCLKLNNVELPEGLVTISEAVFFDCDALTEIDIPASVTSIGKQAFDNSGLKSVNFAENSQLEEIGYAAFKNCFYLTEVTIPASVTTIRSETFSGSTGLERVEFEEGTELKTISSQMFSGCTSLSDITLPSTVTVIGHNAFENCSSLTSINIPAGVTEIFGNAFTGTGLTDVYFEDCSVESWDKITINVPNDILEKIEKEDRIHFAEHNCADETSTYYLVNPDAEREAADYGIVAYGKQCSDCDAWVHEKDAVWGATNAVSNEAEMRLLLEHGYSVKVDDAVAEIVVTKPIEIYQSNINKAHLDNNGNVCALDKAVYVTVNAINATIRGEITVAEGQPNAMFITDTRVNLTRGASADRTGKFIVDEYLVVSRGQKADNIIQLTFADFETNGHALALVEGSPVYFVTGTYTVNAGGTCNEKLTMVDYDESLGDTIYVAQIIDGEKMTSGATTIVRNWNPNDPNVDVSHILMCFADPIEGASNVWVIKHRLYDIPVEGKGPTCTEGGWVYKKCACGYVLDETTKERVEYYVEALGHDEIPHEAKAPTCTEVGWEAHVTCSRCDYTTYNEIQATGHSYPEVWTENTENGTHYKECGVCGYVLEENHIYPTTWLQEELETDVLSGKHYRDCTVCGGRQEHEHDFDIDEGTYYSKQLVDADGNPLTATSGEKLIDVYWGQHCKECGWVEIYKLERTTEGNEYTVRNKDTGENITYNNVRTETCSVNTESGKVSEEANFVLYPVSNFDDMWTLMFYGYSVYLVNDIAVPAGGTTELVGTARSKGNTSITVSSGSMRGFRESYVILDLNGFNLSSNLVGSNKVFEFADGTTTTKYVPYSIFRTNVNMLIDGTTSGSSVNVKELFITNNGGAFVEFRGGTYTTEGNSLVDMNTPVLTSDKTGFSNYASRVIVKDTTTTFIANGDNPEIFTATIPRKVPEAGKTGNMIAVLEGGIYYNWQPSSYNSKDVVGWTAIWVIHNEYQDADNENIWIINGHKYAAKTVQEATCTEDGYKMNFCNCGYVDDAQIPIPATGHAYKYTDNGDGTCTGVCEHDSLHTVTHDHEILANGCKYCGVQEVVYALNNDNVSYSVISVGKDFSGGVLTIPSELADGGKVTQLGSKDQSITNTYALFKDNTDITDVIIPASVTTIGRDVFKGCSNLQTVTFQGADDGTSQLSVIYNYAFKNCTSLQSITMPSSVTIIREGVFYGCTGLKNVTLNSGLQRIVGLVFYSCTSLEGITIPNTVTEIGAEVFNSCSSLKSITFEQGISLTAISNRLFYQCRALENIIIPASVKTIGNEAFEYDNALKSVTFEANNVLTTIGAEAFHECKSLVSIDIPYTVSTIKGYVEETENGNVINIRYGDAFRGCLALETVTFGNNTALTEIAEYTFAGCENLKAIDIPVNVTTIGTSAFDGCKTMTTAKFNADSEGNSKLTSIGNNAFDECYLVEEFYIPASITRIEDEAFKFCKNATFTFEDPNTITHIGSHSFYDCDGLTNFVVSDKVTSIGAGAFCKCDNLSSIVISKSVTSIGASAFTEVSIAIKVYYTGTEEEWNSIAINASGNDRLIDATKTYNYVA